MRHPRLRMIMTAARSHLSAYRTCLAVAAALFSVVFSVASASDSQRSAESAGFRIAAPGYMYEFPRDHGSHDDFRTEWWYYTGHLSTRNGRRFGFQLTFFRRAVAADQQATLPSRWTIRHLYLAHFAVSDIDGKQFRYSEKISREGLGKAGADSGHLRVWTDRWIAEGAKEPLSHHLVAEQNGVAIDLTLRQLKPPVFHGEDGISRKGQEVGQASHYYSLTRLGTNGRLTIDGETFEVTGTSWMDHEFGSAELGEDLVGWDWFSLQLEDGSDIMLYRLRRADGSLDGSSSGTLVYPDGHAGSLSRDDAQVAVLSHWTSPASGARYPAKWKVTVPCLQLDVEVTPLMAGQELATRRSTQVTYWEGAVQVSGTAQGRAIRGHGYVELTGYAERFAERL
ncbi:MAG TPA: lipocalin-like domain-containing protein [Nitrospiraceae bacterium]|nr:lipocalin-like domain-containing protein [Nitrospiraceae bacterium]